MPDAMASQRANGIIDGAGGVGVTAALTVPGYFETPQANIGVFHQSDIDITDHFTVTLGLRYDYNHTKILYNQIFQVKTESVDENIHKIFNFITERNTDKNTLHIIVSFGVAQNRKVNTIETLAQNYIYDLVKDKKIDETKPDKFYSKNPVKNIVKGIRYLNEVECKFSNDAGTYLCNYMLYTTMNKYLNDENVCSFFIHVPTLENYDLNKHENFFKNFISILEDLYIVGNDEKRNKILGYEIINEEDEHVDEWKKKKKENKNEKEKEKDEKKVVDKNNC
jgi:pyrrolidone-carboxylate peptidase